MYPQAGRVNSTEIDSRRNSGRKPADGDFSKFVVTLSSLVFQGKPVFNDEPGSSKAEVYT
jgi:hypothetical protein